MRYYLCYIFTFDSIIWAKQGFAGIMFLLASVRFCTNIPADPVTLDTKTINLSSSWSNRCIFNWFSTTGRNSSNTKLFSPSNCFPLNGFTSLLGREVFCACGCTTGGCCSCCCSCAISACYCAAYAASTLFNSSTCAFRSATSAMDASVGVNRAFWGGWEWGDGELLFLSLSLGSLLLLGTSSMLGSCLDFLILSLLSCLLLSSCFPFPFVGFCPGLLFWGFVDSWGPLLFLLSTSLLFLSYFHLLSS